MRRQEGQKGRRSEYGKEIRIEEIGNRKEERGKRKEERGKRIRGSEGKNVRRWEDKFVTPNIPLATNH